MFPLSPLVWCLSVSTVKQDLQDLTDHARVKIEANNPAQSGFTAAILELTAEANGGDTARLLVRHNTGLSIETEKAQTNGDNGNIRFRPSGSQVMLLMPQSVTVYGTFQDLSDAGLKDEQREVHAETALGVLRSVPVKTYRRSDLPGQPSRLGFIAQEVEAAVPPEWTNLVGEAPSDEGEPLKGLDYARLTAVLWSVCQSLDARCQSLDARLKKLEAKKK